MNASDRLIFVVTMSVAAVASMTYRLDAQQRPRMQPPETPPRIAGIAPAPQPAVVVHPLQPGTVTILPAPAVHVVRPVAVGFVPAIVLADGRIFADFGRGYEQVVRSCAVQAPVVYGHAGATAPGTIGGGSAVITAPRYEAPNYRQGGTSASAQSQSGTSTIATSPVPAQISTAGTSCWTTNSAGRVIVVR